MDLNKLKTDPTLEVDGVWVPFGDAKLRVARLNNPQMTAAYAAKIRPYRGGAVPEEANRQIMIECLAAHVLLGWEGLTNDGEVFPYSGPNAVTALKIPDFAEFVLEAARDFELFRQRETKDAVASIAKN